MSYAESPITGERLMRTIVIKFYLLFEREKKNWQIDFLVKFIYMV